MKPWLRSGLLPLVVLCVGLVVLGVLEYRWTDELARAEQDRMRAGMEAASARFGDDLSREMGRMLRAFRPAPRSAAGDEGRYARQAEEWRAEAADPDLLSAVLIARDDGGSWQLRRLEGDRFADMEWPFELEPVHARLLGRDVVRMAPGVSPFVPEVPALVMGARPPRPPGPAEDEAAPRSRGEDEVLILVLDATVLKNAVIPALAGRQFADLEADVAVVSGARGDDVVWSSRPGFPSRVDRADVVTPLLAGPPAPGGPRHGMGLRPWPGFHGPPPRGPGAPLDAMGPEAAGRSAGGPAETRGAPSFRREPRDAWRLVVAHRAGSLGAAVAKTRGRNLAIGLGVLALLGGSAAFLAVTGHRARALARQQMTFVAAVSHELRTPLAAIRAAGQNLADGVVADPEQVRRYGAMMRREGERLTALVEQTLELSGMLGGGRSARLEEVDPAHLVDEVLAEVRPRERVDVDVPSGLGPVVADGVALHSALRNLVDNALKHGAGRSVAVHARMGATAGGARELQFVVEDGGPGVPTAEADRLFEPFYRGSAAQEQGLPGSGLGLSLVRRVAEAHGGRVSVGAGPGGRGAAFTLHLPLTPVESRG